MNNEYSAVYDHLWNQVQHAETPSQRAAVLWVATGAIQLILHNDKMKRSLTYEQRCKIDSAADVLSGVIWGIHNEIEPNVSAKVDYDNLIEYLKVNNG